jgi:hypothetical protein
MVLNERRIMGKIVTTSLFDDKEGKGTPADQTVVFGKDGVEYEIDLCSKNAAKLRAELDEWVPYARIIKGKARTTHTPKPIGSGLSSEQLSEVRRWLRANGHPDLSDRGRVSKELIAKYEAEAGRPQQPVFTSAIRETPQ